MTYDEMIAVLQAAKEGKQIQYRQSGMLEEKWIDCNPPRWNFALHKYRIKPEPRVIYVRQLREGCLSGLWGGAPESVVPENLKEQGFKAVKFIEVMDE